MDFSDAQFQRYARHLILDEVGEEGQAKLMRARVLVVGAGGLGSPALMYLAAAGIGTIGIVDDDTVDLTNLQRQIVHTTDRVGQNKVESAIEGLARHQPRSARRALQAPHRRNQRAGARRRVRRRHRRQRQFRDALPRSTTRATSRRSRWSPPRCCASKASCRRSRPMTAPAHATAASSPNGRPRTSCRAARRPASSAPSPA